MEEKPVASSNAFKTFLDSMKGQTILKGVGIGLMAASLAVSTAALVVVLTSNNKSEPTTHVVTFRNYDNAFITSETIKDGEVATDPEITPTKPADKVNTYSFSGWDKEFTTTITEDTTFTAQYAATLIPVVTPATTYTVRFINDDAAKSVLYSCSVKSGDKASYQGVTPTKSSDASYAYTFKGWDTDPTTVTITADKDFTAQYDKVAIVAPATTYAVRFLNEDGTVLYSEMVASGEKASYQGITPTKESKDAGTSYKFTSWDKSLTGITANIDFTAQYDTYYEVTFRDESDKLIDRQIVKKGEKASAPSVIPTKAMDGYYSNEFKDWESGGVALVDLPITSSITFTANFTSSLMGNTGLTYVLDETVTPNAYSVKSYSGTDKYIYVPATYNGLKVTSIGASAFKENQSIEHISGGDNITEIKQYAFFACPNLMDASFSTDDDDTESLTIGDYAFGSDSSLTIFSTNSAIISIGDWAFVQDASLLTIKGRDKNQLGVPYDSFACTKVGDSAFYHCYLLKSICSFPGLVTIGDSAFEDCDCLTNIEVDFTDEQANVTFCLESIGNCAFQYCDSLIYMPMTGNNLKTIGDNAFQDCPRLTNIFVINNNNNLVSIGSYAFAGCIGYNTSLSLTLNGLTSIGDYAFRGCSNINSISLTCPNLKTIGDGVFKGCSSASKLTFATSTLAATKNWFSGCSFIDSDITLSDSVTSIGNYTFYDCWNRGMLANPFESTITASGVTSIGNGAFSYCPFYKYKFGLLKTISDEAFIHSSIKAIPSFNTTSSSNSIGANAFEYCKSLTTIDLTSSANGISLASDSFANIGKIENLRLPYSVTFSGKSPFDGDTFATDTSIHYAGSKTAFTNIATAYNGAYDESAYPLFPSGTYVVCSDGNYQYTIA